MLDSREHIKQPLGPLRIKQRLSRFLGKGLTTSSAASPNSTAEIFYDENSAVTLTTLPTLPLSAAISSSKDSAASSVKFSRLANNDNDIISKICICFQDVCVCTPSEPEQPPQPVKLKPRVCKDHTCVCFNQICKCATPLCVCCTIDEKSAQKIHHKPNSYRPFVSLVTTNDTTDAKVTSVGATDAKNVEHLSSLFVPLDAASPKDSDSFEKPLKKLKGPSSKPDEASRIQFFKAMRDFKMAIKKGLEKSYKYKLKIQFKFQSLRRTKTSSLSWFKRRRDNQETPSPEACMPLCCRRYDITPAPNYFNELKKRNYYHERYLSHQKPSDRSGTSHLRAVIMRAKLKISASQVRKTHAKTSMPKISSNPKSQPRKNLPIVVGEYYAFKSSAVRPVRLISPLLTREETVDEKLARLLAEFARHRSFAATKAYKFELRIRNRGKGKPSTSQVENPAVRLPLVPPSVNVPQKETKPSKKDDSKKQSCQDAITLIEDYAREMGMFLAPELKVRMDADRKAKIVSPLRNLNVLKVIDKSEPTLDSEEMHRLKPGHYSFVRIRATSKSGETRSAMVVRRDDVGDRKFSSIFRDCIERIDKVPETQSTMSVGAKSFKNETLKETGNCNQDISSILNAVESMQRALLSHDASNDPKEKNVKSEVSALQPGLTKSAAISRNSKLLDCEELTNQLTGKVCESPLRDSVKKIYGVEERAFKHASGDEVQETLGKNDTKLRVANGNKILFKDCSPVTKNILKDSSASNKPYTLQRLGTKSQGSVDHLAK